MLKNNTTLFFPDESLQAIEDSLIVFKTTRQIGFFLSTLYATELSYQVIERSNEYLAGDPYNSICLFGMKPELPTAPANFAIFNYKDLSTYHDTLVVTDGFTWKESLCCPSKKKIFYIFDPVLLNNLPPEIVKQINESGYTLVARSSYHKDYLKSLGYRIDATMENINISFLMEL